MQINKRHAAGELRDSISKAFLKASRAFFLSPADQQSFDVSLYYVCHPARGL
jgi:hypothetical protein